MRSGWADSIDNCKHHLNFHLILISDFIIYHYYSPWSGVGLVWPISNPIVRIKNRFTLRRGIKICLSHLINSAHALLIMLHTLSGLPKLYPYRKLARLPGYWPNSQTSRLNISSPWAPPQVFIIQHLKLVQEIPTWLGEVKYISPDIYYPVPVTHSGHFHPATTDIGWSRIHHPSYLLSSPWN